MSLIIEDTIFPRILRILFYSQEHNFSNLLTERENLMRNRSILTNSSKNIREITIKRRRKLKKMRRSDLLKRESTMRDKCLDLVIL